MNDMVKDVTGVLMAIIGVAILFTLVNPNNKTSSVIQAGSTEKNKTSPRKKIK